MKNNSNPLPKKRVKIEEGRRKIIYQTNDDYILTQFFKDDFYSTNGIKQELLGKGILSNTISSFLMNKLAMIGVETHFVEKVNMSEQLINKAEAIPVTFVVNQIASGRYVEDMGLQEGFVFEKPMIDILTKSTIKKTPINEEQIINFDWLDKEELEDLKTTALNINYFLVGLFASVNIRLVACKLEFGRIFSPYGFSLVLIDELSPETLQLWDMNSNKKLDASSIDVESNESLSCYEEIIKRLNIN